MDFDTIRKAIYRFDALGAFKADGVQDNCPGLDGKKLINLINWIEDNPEILDTAVRIIDMDDNEFEHYKWLAQRKDELSKFIEGFKKLQYIRLF